MGILGKVMCILIATKAMGGTSSDMIIRKVDSVANAPKTKKATFCMELKDASGNIEKRKGITYEANGNRRLLKFTEPASIRKIAFLSLPNDVMYIYLPSFRKVRRIATSVKNTNFAGTDFTYDELSTMEYSKKYRAKLLSQNDSVWVLKLLPKSNSAYHHLIMHVDKKHYIPLKIEFYDKSGTLWKVLEEKNIKKIKEYYVPTLLIMKDLKKKHQTKMDIKNLELDINIPEKVFTRRYLRR